MTINLNKRAYARAQQRIDAGKAVLDNRDAWSEHRPSAQAEIDFIREHGFAEYQTWFLGVDDEEAEGTKSRYKFPYGDLEKVHRCGVRSAESRAAQDKPSTSKTQRRTSTDARPAATSPEGFVLGVRRRGALGWTRSSSAGGRPARGRGFRSSHLRREDCLVERTRAARHSVQGAQHGSLSGGSPPLFALARTHLEVELS